MMERDRRSWNEAGVVRTWALTACAAAALLGTLPAGAAAQHELAGEWTLQVATTATERAGETMLQLVLHAPGMNSRPVPADRFIGLAHADLISATRAAVSLRLREDAGTFELEGGFERGRGAGTFRFRPDPAFADELERRGMARPTPADQLTLARHGVGLAFLLELAEQGYQVPTTAAFVRASSSGLGLSELREFGSVGYRFGTLEAAVRLRSSGVTAEYIRQLARAGLDRVQADDLMRLRAAGVDADLVRRETARTGRAPDIDELLRARSAGSRIGGGADAAATTPLEGRWVLHGVTVNAADIEIFWTDGTNWRRHLPLAALSGIFPVEPAAAPRPVDFRLAGDAGAYEFTGTAARNTGSGTARFVPEPGFAATLRGLGIAGADTVTDHQLKNLVWGGISAEVIREFQTLGLTSLNLDEILQLAIFSVTPEYVAAMKALRMADATSVPSAVRLRIAGVTLHFLEELRAAGRTDVSASDVLELWRPGRRR